MEENNLQQQPVTEQPVTEQPITGQPATGEQPYQQQTTEQPMYQYGQMPPVMPAAYGQPEKKEKKGKGAVIAVIAGIVILLLALGGILLYKLVFRSPEARLVKGLVNLEEELGSYAAPIGEKLDYASVTEKTWTEPSTFDMSLNVTVPADDMATMGIDFFMDYDNTKRLLDSEIALNMYNIDLVKADLMVAGDKMYVSLPGWAEGTYFVNLDTLGKDYNASEWSWLLDYDLPEDFSYDVFNTGKKGEYDEFDDALEKAIKESLENIQATMTIEDSKDTVEIERGGKTVKCGGVRVVLDKEALNRAIEDIRDAIRYSDYMQAALEEQAAEYAEYMDEEEIEELYDEVFEMLFSARFKNDVELLIYMDKQDRIVSIVTGDEIKFKGTELNNLEIDLVFSGKERALDEVSGTVTMETENATVDMSVDREAKLTKDTYTNDFKLYMENVESGFGMDFLYESDWDLEEDEFSCELSVGDDYDSYAFKVKGGFSDIVKGESFTLELGELSFAENDETVFTMFGSLTMAPFTGSFTEPSDATDFFGMSEEEITAMVEEMENALYDFLFQMY